MPILTSTLQFDPQLPHSDFPSQLMRNTPLDSPPKGHDHIVNTGMTSHNVRPRPGGETSSQSRHITSTHLDANGPSTKGTVLNIIPPSASSASVSRSSKIFPPGTTPSCSNCQTQTTPLWRRSPVTGEILCNACALFLKMKGRNRPISLKTDIIKPRNRSRGEKPRKVSAESSSRRRTKANLRVRSQEDHNVSNGGEKKIKEENEMDEEEWFKRSHKLVKVSTADSVTQHFTTLEVPLQESNTAPVTGRISSDSAKDGRFSLVSQNLSDEMSSRPSTAGTTFSNLTAPLPSLTFDRRVAGFDPPTVTSNATVDKYGRIVLPPLRRRSPSFESRYSQRESRDHDLSGDVNMEESDERERGRQMRRNIVLPSIQTLDATVRTDFSIPPNNRLGYSSNPSHYSVRSANSLPPQRGFALSSSRDSPIAVSVSQAHSTHTSPNCPSSNHQSPEEPHSYRLSPDAPSSASSPSSGYTPSTFRSWGDNNMLRPVMDFTRLSRDADRGRSHTRKGKLNPGNDVADDEVDVDVDIKRLDLNGEDDEGLGRSISSNRNIRFDGNTPRTSPQDLNDDVALLKLKISQLELANIRLQNTLQVQQSHMRQSEHSSISLSSNASLYATEEETRGFVKDLASHGILHYDIPIDAPLITLLDLLKRKYNYKPGDLLRP